MAYRKLSIAILLCLCHAFPVNAGTISSGGGVIFGDTANPWFLENVTEAKYCIELDEANFGVPLEKARDVVVSALREWKDIFANNAWTKIYSPGEVSPYGTIRLATQNFVEEPCHAGIDIKFQLGTISPEQVKAYGINTKSTVATTVRMSYDEVMLRGNGFIYVGPQSGSLHFESANTAPDPWNYCDACLLRMTLMHELGHVFGLAHTEDRSSLMGAAFVDLITRKNFIDSMEKEQSWPMLIEHFKRSSKIFSAEPNFAIIRCNRPLGMENELAKFLNVSMTTPCLKTVIENEEISFYAGESHDGPFKFLGRSTSAMGGGFRSSTSYLIHVKLNSNQRVFTNYPRDENELLGPVAREQSRVNIDFILADGTRRVISYRMQAGNKVQIYGAMDGRIFIFDAD